MRPLQGQKGGSPLGLVVPLGKLQGCELNWEQLPDSLIAPEGQSQELGAEF